MHHEEIEEKQKSTSQITHGAERSLLPSSAIAMVLFAQLRASPTRARTLGESRDGLILGPSPARAHGLLIGGAELAGHHQRRQIR